MPHDHHEQERIERDSDRKAQKIDEWCRVKRVHREILRKHAR
jgi:hypothetical protein